MPCAGNCGWAHCHAAIKAERDALRVAGDAMQSAASRMAEYINSRRSPSDPYEVVMAALEADGATQAWTEARRDS